MQLLMMAMQTDQEDSNGNDASDVGNAYQQDSISHTSHHTPQQQYQSPVTATSCPYILLSCPEDRPAAMASNAEPDIESEMVPSTLGQTSRPDQLFSQSARSLSPGLCKDSVCSAASSGVDSDSSSSPDINSNTLIVGFGKTELSSVGTDQKDQAAQAEQVGALRQEAHDDAPVSYGNLPLIPVWMETGEDDKAKEQLSKADHSELTDSVSLVPDFSGLYDPSLASGDVPTQQIESSSQPPNIGGNAVVLSRSGTQSSGSESPGQRADEEPFSTPGHPAQTTAQDITVYPSYVDKEIGNRNTTKKTAFFSTGNIFLPSLPQVLQQAGPAGDDRSQSLPDLSAAASCTHDHQVAKVIPASILIRPPVAEPQLIHEDRQATNVHANPPIWTTLALHSIITKHVNSVASSAAESSDTITACLKQHMYSSPSSQSMEAKMAADIRAVSLSPTLLRHKPSKRVSPYRHRSAPPSTRPCYTQAMWRLSQSMMYGRMKNMDEFEQPFTFGLERHLEDECALYASHPQLSSGDSAASCDRKGLLDPVAKILNEGDTMHFVPIVKESSLNTDPGQQGPPTLVSKRPG